MSKSNGKNGKDRERKRRAPAKNEQAITDTNPQGAGRSHAMGEATQAKVLEFIAEGGSRKKACEYVGVGHSAITEEARRNAQFQDRLTRAEAECYLTHVKTVAKASTEDTAGDWKAAAFLLERKFRDEYGKELKIDQTASLNVRVAGLSPEESKAELALHLQRLGLAYDS